MIACEAMCLGTPVITSTADSLRETVGEAGLTVKPLDVEAISKAIHTLDLTTPYEVICLSVG